MKTTVGEQIEQLQTNKKLSNKVAGESINRQKEDLISNQTSESNITPNSDEKPWKIVSRGYKKTPLCKSYYVLPNPGNHKSV